MKKISLFLLIAFVANIYVLAQTPEAKIIVVKDTDKNTVFCDVPDDTSTPIKLVSDQNDPKTKKTDVKKIDKTKTKTKDTPKEKTSDCDKVKDKKDKKSGCGGCTEHEIN